MLPCCRPARAVLPAWAARLPHLSRPSPVFSSFTTSRTASRIQPIILKRSRRLKVYSFKGNSQSDEGSRDGRRSSKKTASLSCSQQESDDIVNSASSIRNKVSVSPEREEETTTGSQAVENLFKRWLILLRSRKPSSIEEQIHKEDSGQQQPSETNSGRQEQLVGNLLKAVFARIWALDATLKFPLLITPSAYLVVRLIYGVEIAQELTPLWVVCPILVALYVYIIQRIYYLYVSFFGNVLKLILSLPTCWTFIREGKLNAYIYQHTWQHVETLWNMDYKEYSRQKLKQFLEMANEMMLDYVEMVWPFYCRLLRFLKKLNFI